MICKVQKNLIFTTHNNNKMEMDLSHKIINNKNNNRRKKKMMSL